MKAVILASGSMECADMYYASCFLSYDPFVYVEAGGRRYLAVYCQEVERARSASAADEVWDQDEFLGTPESGGVSPGMWLPAVVVGAARRAGVTSAVVPDWFPVAGADALRAAGIEVTVDAMVIRSRRRAKSPAEVAAIEGALRITEASLELIRECLRRATVDYSRTLLLDGVALTLVQGEVRAFYALHQCEGELPIVAGGAQAADGMECGHGPLRAGEPIVCDIFPRHSDTRFHGDMTRVFCVGEPPRELVRAHHSVHRANELARSLVRPGVRGSEVYAAVCEMLHGEGYLTPLHHVGAGGDEALSVADFLGHGLGIDLHEDWIGLDPGSTEPLREGDVVTVEPELYRVGWGCVRLEDVVLVTADGCRTLSRFDYELL
jgi:Xaa-Pro aminopeptidase